MKEGLRRLALNKGTKLVLGASLLALCVIGGGLWFQESQELPATPRLAYEQMIQAMLQKDETALRRIALPSVVNTLAYCQGGKASDIYVYDFLTEKKGIEPELLKEPWGLWQQWAKTVDLQKISLLRADDYWQLQKPPTERYAISAGNLNAIDSDCISFYFEKRSNGWLLTKMDFVAGAAFKD